MAVQRFALVLAVLSLGAAACSDPVSPPAQAAMAIDKTSVSNCFTIMGALSEPSTSQDYIAITNPNTAPPDDVRIVDGESGAQVSCDVSGSGTFTGTLTTRRTNFVVSEGQASGGSGTANISLWDAQSQETVSGACTLVVNSLNPGAIWASFDCPMLESPPTAVCRGSGAFVFENCGE